MRKWDHSRRRWPSGRMSLTEQSSASKVEMDSVSYPTSSTLRVIRSILSRFHKLCDDRANTKIALFLTPVSTEKIVVFVGHWTANTQRADCNREESNTKKKCSRDIFSPHFTYYFFPSLNSDSEGYWNSAEICWYLRWMSTITRCVLKCTWACLWIRIKSESQHAS